MKEKPVIMWPQKRNKQKDNRLVGYFDMCMFLPVAKISSFVESHSKAKNRDTLNYAMILSHICRLACVDRKVIFAFLKIFQLHTDIMFNDTVSILKNQVSI